MQEPMDKILFITCLIILIFITGFLIKRFVKKEDTFKKSCSSIDAKSGKRVECTCQNKPEQICDNSEK
jgi:hypothetical protein